MALIRSASKELKLTTVCAKGTVAEWDPVSLEFQAYYQLEIRDGAKIKLCTFNKRYIVTF
jgi:hypothetical protein